MRQCRNNLLMRIFLFVTTVMTVTRVTLCSAGDANSAASQQLLQLCLSDQSDVIAVALIQELFIDETTKKTIDINVQDPVSGQTALMAAVLRGKPHTVELLLFQGADPSIPEKDGYLPAHGAAFQGRTDVMDVLHANGLSKQEFHTDGYLPYHRACWGRTDRHTAFISFLLKNGIVDDVDVPSKDGRTCRDMTYNPQTIKVLDFWADKKKASHDGMTQKASDEL